MSEQQRYRELAEALRERIAAGEFIHGVSLPSEQAFATEYGVTRTVVRSALHWLEQRGLVTARRNIGWFLREPHQVQGFDRLRSFSQWAEGRGMLAGARIVSRENRPATEREAQLLRIPVGATVLRWSRVRTLDDRIVMLERSTWAPWVAPLLDDFPDDAVSSTQALADAGVAVVFGNHRIEAVAASSEEARLLGVRRSSPLLQVRREVFAKDGRVVEFGVDRYLPNTIAFEAQAAGAADQVEPRSRMMRGMGAGAAVLFGALVAHCAPWAIAGSDLLSAASDLVA
ncbi:GntR family transcriptional regulator [Herbiconiux sp. P17]|uniref:GntR family transcriptional regulator n=1 Tax=Herbiconiux wuyangfengii TaxID=3342794 RepID=UPI0035B954DB